MPLRARRRTHNRSRWWRAAYHTTCWGSVPVAVITTRATAAAPPSRSEIGSGARRALNQHEHARTSPNAIASDVAHAVVRAAHRDLAAGRCRMPASWSRGSMPTAASVAVRRPRTTGCDPFVRAIGMRTANTWSPERHARGRSAVRRSATLTAAPPARSPPTFESRQTVVRVHRHARFLELSIVVVPPAASRCWADAGGATVSVLNRLSTCGLTSVLSASPMPRSPISRRQPPRQPVRQRELY